MNSKLISEYESLLNNDFWALFVKTLAESYKTRALALRDAPLDKVARLQGELIAIDWVMSRPKALIEILKEEKPNG